MDANRLTVQVDNLQLFTLIVGVGAEFSVWAENKEQAAGAGEAISNGSVEDRFEEYEGNSYTVVPDQLRTPVAEDLVVFAMDENDNEWGAEYSVGDLDEVLTAKELASLTKRVKLELASKAAVSRVDFLVEHSEPPLAHINHTAGWHDVRILAEEIRRLRGILAAHGIPS